jgi:hypothetical protein
MYLNFKILYNIPTMCMQVFRMILEISSDKPQSSINCLVIKTET